MVLPIYGQAKTGQIGYLRSLYDLKWLQKLVCILEMLNIKIIPNNDATNALWFKKTQGF